MLDHARSISITAVFTLAAAASASAQVVPAQDFDASVAGTVWVSSFCCDRTTGWEFTMNADKEVTALGVYDRAAPAPDPGLGNPHQIAIWDLTQTIVAMSTVPSGAAGTLNNGFRYQAITPFTLLGVDPMTGTAGINYKIAAFWPSANFDHYPDLNQSGIMPTYHPDVVFVQSTQLFGSAFGFPTTNSGNSFLAGTTNFLINDSGAPGPIGTNYCGPAVPHSGGVGGTIAATGIDFAGGQPLNIEASNLPPNQFGFFLTSMSQAFFNPPGSQGFICLGSPIGRFNGPGQIMNSGPGGTFAIDVDTNAMPVSPPVPILSGETWNFQAWFRDNNPGLTNNFTDGISILFQ